MNDWICNTSACIGGWAVMIERKRKSLKLADKWWFKTTFPQQAREITQATGMSPSAPIGKMLFFIEFWLINKTRTDYRLALHTGNDKAKAKAAADYVRWFVENHTKVEEKSK
jgi:hypothetical protein